MDNFDLEKAYHQLQLSMSQKQKLIPVWRAAEDYFNNTIIPATEYDPSRLASRVGNARWGLSNLIPDAVRAYAAWVINSPFDIKVDAMGDKGDEIRYIAARALHEQIQYYKQRPQFIANIREIAIRQKLFNIVGHIDGWCEKRGEPHSRLISHYDLFLDPTGWANINEPNGPRWAAVRYYLTQDQVETRYGPDVKLQKGIMLGTDGEPRDEQRAWQDKYEIIEWYGIDETEIEIGEAEQRDAILAELEAVQNGQYTGPSDEIDHAYALKYGDWLMIGHAVAVTQRNEDEIETIKEALQVLTAAGAGETVDAYLVWRASHEALVEQGEIGGFRPKYPGYVYHCDFQMGQSDPVLGPETCDFPHYQIPLSIYRAHLTTRALFGYGPMSEVLSEQTDIEWWEKCLMDHSNYTARPPFMIDLDTLDPRYRTPKGMNQLVENLRRGHRIIWMRGTAGTQRAGGMDPHFAKVGSFSFDVMRLIEYKRYRIMEVIGPTPVMRGQVSGEVSGKAFGMRQQAAARPIIDTLSLIEGPLQKHLERTLMNILEFSSIDKIEDISGPEGAGAIQWVRENIPDFNCVVKVDLGTGMPTDWHTRANMAIMFAQMGWLSDPQEVQEKLGLPWKLEIPPMPVAPGPGQGSPPAPQPMPT